MGLGVRFGRPVCDGVDRGAFDRRADAVRCAGYSTQVGGREKGINAHLRKAVHAAPTAMRTERAVTAAISKACGAGPT